MATISVRLFMSFDLCTTPELNLTRDISMCFAKKNYCWQRVFSLLFQEELVIIRHNEKATIEQQKDIPKTSTIRLCSAYIDNLGVMRMKSRIDAATISDSAKRPIILSRHHYVTQLIIYYYHHKYKHQHHQTVLNEIQQKFWIPKLRVLLGAIRNGCQKCKNTAAKRRIPEMATRSETCILHQTIFVCWY